METTSLVCKNGTVIRPVRRKSKWHYQVFCPVRGLFPPNRVGREEEQNRVEIEAVAGGFGGGRWV